MLYHFQVKNQEILNCLHQYFGIHFLKLFYLPFQFSNPFLTLPHLKNQFVPEIVHLINSKFYALDENGSLISNAI
jgi:hypothetical protein